MKKQRPIVLLIPNLCTQNWDEMNPDQAGRYCDYFRHTVTDITSLGDASVYKLFQNENRLKCVRVFEEQLNRTIVAPPESSHFLPLTFGFGLIPDRNFDLRLIRLKVTLEAQIEEEDVLNKKSGAYG